ncbi:MAG: hypothetical protein ACRBN8_13485 [Nannocystales bacterium]
MTDTVLSEAAANRLVRKIQRAKSWDKWDPIVEETEYDNVRGCQIAWDLHGRGLLDVGTMPGLWHALANHPELAPPAAVASMLSTLERFTAREDEDDCEEDDDDYEEDDYDEEDEEFCQDNYEEDEEDEEDEDDDDDDDEEEDENEDPWPESLDALAFVASLRDPAAFDNVDAFPEPVRRGLAFTFLRTGKTLTDAQRDRLRQDLAKQHLDQGLPVELQMVVDGAPTKVKLFDDDYARLQPNAHHQQIIDSLGGSTSWAEAILAAARKRQWNLSAERSRPAVRIAPVDDLAHFFATYDAGASKYRAIYEILTTLRNDSVDDLLRVAEQLDEKDDEQEADAVRTVAILRARDQGLAIDRALDEKFAARGRYLDEYAPQAPYVGLEQTLDALRHLGPERARAILEREISGRHYDALGALPSLVALDDLALTQRCLEAILPEMQHAGGDWVFGWRPHGLGVLPLLATTHDTDERPKTKEVLHLAILHLLADASDRGIEFDAQWDRFLHFRDHEDLNSYDFVHKVVPQMRRILAKLPEDRASTAMLNGLDPEQRTFARPFSCFAVRPIDAVLDRGFDLLAQHASRLNQPTHDYVSEVVRDLGERVHSRLQAAMETSQSPQLAKLFRAALGEQHFETLMAGSEAAQIKAETHVQKVQRIAAELKGRDDLIRIYLLEVDHEAQAAPGEMNRVGDTAIGFTAETWPTRSDSEEEDDPEDSRKEHVFTLDLASVPELQSQFPDAAAIALFIDSRDDNEAYEPHNDETTLVPLTRADLEHGELATDERDANPFAVIPVDIPAAVFDIDGENADDPALHDLRTAVYQSSGRVLGHPIWLQGDDDDGDPGSVFLLQFDEGFASMNLGDCGVMYVYDDTAFWQCH